MLVHEANRAAIAVAVAAAAAVAVASFHVAAIVASTASP